MSQTIFIIIMLVVGLIIFMLYKFIIPSTESDNAYQDFEEEARLQKESAYSYHSGDINKTIRLTAKTVENDPNDLVSKFILGKLYLEKKEYKKAIEQFEQIKLLNKKHLPTREQLAESYIGVHNYAKAVEELNYILDKKPNDLNILYKLAITFEKSRDLHSSINTFKRILQFEKNNTRIREKLANLCILNGEFTRAISEFENLFVNDKNIEYARKLAELYMTTKRTNEAIAMFETILEENTNEIRTIKQVAYLYKDMGEIDKALEYFEKLIPLLPEEYDAIMDNVAQIHLFLGNYDVVIEICEEILRKKPDADKAKINQSKAYLAKNEFQKAIDIVKDLLTETTLKDKESSLMNYLSSLFGTWAVFYYEQGNYQDAFEKFMLAIQYNDKNPEIYYNLALTNLKIRNLEEAVSQFKRAVGISPENATYQLMLGKVYLQMDNLKNALTSIEKAIEINPNYSDAYFELGNLYEMQNTFDNCILLYKKVLDIEPYHTEARYKLAIAYERKGEKDKAVKEYKKVIELNPAHEDAIKNLNILN